MAFLISQLIRYARACSSYECFILRAVCLSYKLIGQGYVKERLKSSLRKFYGRCRDLTKQYEVPSLTRHSGSWFPQIMTYLFQGLFKDFWGTFSRSFQGLFFVLSNIHSWKNYQQWTFQIRHTEIIWSWVCQKNGGRGRFGYVFLTFFRWIAV